MSLSICQAAPSKMTELSGVWKIGIKEGKLLGDLKPTLLQLTFDGKTEDVGLEQDALENGVLVS